MSSTESHDVNVQGGGRLERFFRLSMDMLGIINGDGYLTQVNPAFEKRVGWEAAALLAEPLLSFVHPDDVEMTAAELDKLIVENKAVQFEHRFRRGDGAYSWLFWQGSPTGEGEVYAIVREVTAERAERLAREAETASWRQKADALAMIAEVGAAAASLQDVSTLLQKVCDLSFKQFGFYQILIFKINDIQGYLEIAAAAGKVAVAHDVESLHIPVTRQKSLIAWTARQAKSVMVNDVSQDERYFSADILPDTKAELLVPILAGTELLGVLDVQADEVDAFSEDDLQMMQTLATQVAVAWQNARTQARSERTKAELAEVNHKLGRESWSAYWQGSRGEGVTVAYEQDEVKLLPASGGKGVVEKRGDVAALAESLIVQGQRIGELQLAEPTVLANEAEELITAVVERLSLHLEALRLSEQTEKALTDTEALYAGSEGIVHADTMSAVLEALVQSTALQRLDRADIMFFDRPWRNEPPDSMEVSAVWVRADKPNPYAPVGTIFALDEFPGATQFNRHTPIIYKDVEATPDIDDGLRQVILERLNARSLLIFPLMAADEWVGFIAGQAETPVAISDDEVRRVTSLVDQAATVIQNKRLFSQVEIALEEAQTLYDASTQLNAAQSLQEILLAAVAPAVRMGATSALLWVIEVDSDGEPSWQRLGALWEKEAVTTALNPIQFNINDFPLNKLWLDNPNEVLLLDDAGDDERLGRSSRYVLSQIGVAAMVYMPLAIGERWVGMINVRWPSKQLFTERDRKMFRSLAAQAASVVDSNLLLQEAQDQATRLQLLTEIEIGLSQAVTEAEILTAMMRLPLHEDAGFLAANLHYLGLDEDGKLATRWAVAHWGRGGIDAEHEGLGRVVQLRDYRLAAVWQEQPDEVLFIENVETDNRVDRDKLLQEQLAQQNIKCVVVVPLRAGGRWQGLLTIYWQQPHAFSLDERFILQQVMEPLAANVASRRAYLAQQDALSETESLYAASAAMNTAQTYNDILDILRKFSFVGDQADAVSLALFSEPWVADTPETFDVIAIWLRSGAETEYMLTQFKMKDYPSAETWLDANQATIVTDVKSDSRLDEATRKLYLRYFQATSIIFEPLVAGGQWIGYINAIYQNPYEFKEEAIRRLSGLSVQAAVAIQSLYRLEETNRLLVSEQRQRRAADGLVRATQRMAESLSEADLQTVLFDEIYRFLRPDEASMYVWAANDDVMRLVQRKRGEEEDVFAVGDVVVRDEDDRLWQVWEAGRSSLVSERLDNGQIESEYCLPWFVGTRKAGVLMVHQTSEQTAIRDEDQRQCEAIVRQAAVSLENAQLFAREQERARREQILREITAKVRRASSVDAIMRTAVHEIGQALGRKAYVYLEDKEQDESSV
ncbi:MAG TPA: GAF domain-containing protein [Anaerolineae bacterium]|nr:GAF domain-containing protein [Anaerolineae bacterium]